MNASRLISSLAVIATAMLVWPGFVGAQEREPGKSVTVVTSASAKVKLVDPQRRVILLETPEGALRAIKVGKAVANLDQVKVGDEVRALALERVIVFVGKGTPGTENAAIVARAPRGARPGILIADTDEISARIAAVDTANRTITLEGAADQAKPIKVSSDVDLSGVKQGDELNVHMTKGLALWVRSPADAGQPAGAILAAQGAAGGIAGLEALDSPGATATVEAIDRDKRVVTLKGESGVTRQIYVGRGALNFEQVEVGDKVRAALTEEVAVAVSKGAALPGAGEGMFVGRAPAGAKPGIVIADTDQITGKIQSIDAANRTLTLDDGDGKPRTIKVGVGVNLSALKPGDDITARTTRALAILVEKP